MAVNVYIAAPFDEQDNAKKLRDALARHGIGCTSRWLHEDASIGNVPASLENKIRFARMDRFDVRQAQAVVLWNTCAYAKSGTGGRHVESGIAFGMSEMPVFVVGVQSNIFAFLPEAVYIPCLDHIGVLKTDLRWDVLARDLARRIKERCPDYGPTWDSPEEQEEKSISEKFAVRMEGCPNERHKERSGPIAGNCSDCGATLFVGVASSDPLEFCDNEDQVRP